MTAIRGFEMRRFVQETSDSIRAAPVFAFYAFVAFAQAVFIGLLFAQMALEIDVYLPGVFGQMAHGAVGSHRVHDLTFGLLVTTGMVGLVAQLWRPSQNVAGMVMALVPYAGLLLAAALAGGGPLSVGDIAWERNPLYLFAALTAVAALVHPAGGTFFRSFSVSRVNWVMVALVGVAAVPLIGFASTNIGLQETAADDHVFLTHYAFMAALAFTIIGVGLLASMRPLGWRLAAWVAGLLPAILGVWSRIYTDASSGLSWGWALAAIVWGAAFITVAERTKDIERMALGGSRAVASASVRS